MTTHNASRPAASPESATTQGGAKFTRVARETAVGREGSATPRPWYTDDTYGDIRTKNRTLLMRQAPSNANRLTQEEKIANAALIVRAVNAHDELVAALRAATDYCDTHHKGTIPIELGKQVRAALALAQEAPNG